VGRGFLHTKEGSYYWVSKLWVGPGELFQRGMVSAGERKLRIGGGGGVKIEVQDQTPELFGGGGKVVAPLRRSCSGERVLLSTGCEDGH